LNVYLALTRPDVVMEGDISVIARGAVELMQRETLRMRRLEFLQITNNPIDQQLVGVEGRFNILKEVARDLGMPTADSMALSQQQADQISQMMIQQTMTQMAGAGQQPAGPPGGVTPAAGGGNTPVVPPGPAPGPGGGPPQGGPPPPPQG